MKLYDVIKGMSVTELAEFLDKNNCKFNLNADRYMCNWCKQSHNGDCPREDDSCLYEKWSDAEIIREWLMQEVQDET